MKIWCKLWSSEPIYAFADIWFMWKVGKWKIQCTYRAYVHFGWLERCGLQPYLTNSMLDGLELWLVAIAFRISNVFFLHRNNVKLFEINVLLSHALEVSQSAISSVKHYMNLFFISIWSIAPNSIRKINSNKSIIQHVQNKQTTKV